MLFKLYLEFFDSDIKEVLVEFIRFLDFYNLLLNNQVALQVESIHLRIFNRAASPDAVLMQHQTRLFHLAIQR